MLLCSSVSSVCSYCDIWRGRLSWSVVHIAITKYIYRPLAFALDFLARNEIKLTPCWKCQWEVLSTKPGVCRIEDWHWNSALRHACFSAWGGEKDLTAQLLQRWLRCKNLNRIDLSFAFVSKHLEQENIVSMGKPLCLGFLMPVVTTAL